MFYSSVQRAASKFVAIYKLHASSVALEDPYLEHFVRMEVGTLANFSGIYNGPDEIRIIAPGGVRDLGRPVHSGITIRITVRKTLDNFTFLADYSTEPVVGSYRDLVLSGHEYLPRFSMNFNIRHVYLEVYT
ncbi:hypothetical protein MTO96_006834 [Rhipicephalus appendiculatus]